MRDKHPTTYQSRSPQPRTPPAWAVWASPTTLVATLLLMSAGHRPAADRAVEPVSLRAAETGALDALNRPEWLGSAIEWHRIHHAAGAVRWEHRETDYGLPICAEQTTNGLRAWRCQRTPELHPNNDVRALLGLPICWWTADAETLDGIRGVGRGRALGLVRYRDMGGTPDIQSLDRIHGVGPSLAGVVSRAVSTKCDRSKERAWRYRMGGYSSSESGSSDSGASEP